MTGVSRDSADLTGGARHDGGGTGGLLQGAARHIRSRPAGIAVASALSISDRDPSATLRDRGIAADHTTLFRWVQACAARLEQRVRRHLRLRTGSWRVDETYIKVEGAWTCLYRAVDGPGRTSDVHLSTRRTLAGYEAMGMIRRGRVHGIGGRDMPAQAAFIATLFEAAARRHHTPQPSLTIARRSQQNRV